MSPPDTNPLFDLPAAIPFDAIHASHVVPALQKLLEEARAEVRAIGAAAPGPARTFDGTLGRLERATERLENAMTLVGHLESVTSHPELRAAYNEVKPDVSAFYAGLPLDAGLWTALQELAATDEAKKLPPVQARLLSRTIEDFVRHGARLDDAGKAKLEELTRELAKISQKFAENVLDSTAAWDLVITDPARLAGLPPSALEAAAESAKSKGVEGWRFTLQAPSVIPVLTYLDDADIRREVYLAYNRRATEPERDNRPLVARILELRHQKATLLGYANFADLVLEDRMAKTGAQARAFVDDLTRRTDPAFARENEILLAFRAAHGGTGPMQPWDLGYWAEKQRLALYDFDEEELRPYFPMPRVISGLFETAERLYGVRVTAAPDLPTWGAEVQAWRVTDGDGSDLGHFYSDFYPREEKRGGAWMNGLLTGAFQGGTITAPHVGVICANVSPPMGDKPALLTHDEVETLFHEFGHLLHHMLSRVEIRSLAGTNVAWDFVELPSQIMENWTWERAALDLFARHHETGEPIPEPLFEKLSRARTYRAANAQMRQLGFATVDLTLHVGYVPERDGDPTMFARDVMQRFAPLPLPADYAFVTSFGHLFASEVGYAAGYYSYKWAEVLDADAFTEFKSRGVFSREVGDRFKKSVLERGNGADPMALYREFMGREPDLRALLERSGLAEDRPAVT